ncbi:MAG TPA: M23 family metallopeptidase [Coleofasciculaceae cyanobacterium]
MSAHWFPMLSAIFWLLSLTVGTKANSANVLPLAPDRPAAAQVVHTSLPESTPAMAAAESIVNLPTPAGTSCKVNECQPQLQQVIISGVNWTAQEPQSVETDTGFVGYPLPLVAPVALNFGWHQNPSTGQAKFHSGIDLLASVGTSVLSVEEGTVAFAGIRGNYGHLVVVNHQGGRQTRYAHLKDVNVITGQKVKTGDTLGTVGATGRPDTDKPHLHFEVRYNSPEGWVAQDPELSLKPRPTAQS